MAVVFMPIPEQTTPVLLLVFNRPDKVRQLIKALETIRPTTLYVSADGPRTQVAADLKKCAETRALFSKLPWPCTVHTNFSDVNLGCKQGPVAGISWFFSHVEAGIILEDDCIPDPSFFTFCTTLLTHYEDDQAVMHISGNNFQDGVIWGDGSYYFSLYTHSWGWATWRRAWEKYAPALEAFKEFDQSDKIKTLPLSSKAQDFWIKNFRQTLAGTDSWDSLWLYTVWHSGGVALLPNKNLVTNIGFDSEATHTTSTSKAANIQTKTLATIVHPTTQTVQTEADELTFERHFYHPPWRRAAAKLNAILALLWK